MKIASLWWCGVCGKRAEWAWLNVSVEVVHSSLCSMCVVIMKTSQFHARHTRTRQQQQEGHARKCTHNSSVPPSYCTKIIQHFNFEEHAHMPFVYFAPCVWLNDWTIATKKGRWGWFEPKPNRNVERTRPQQNTQQFQFIAYNLSFVISSCLRTCCYAHHFTKTVYFLCIVAHVEPLPSYSPPLLTTPPPRFESINGDLLHPTYTHSTNTHHWATVASQKSEKASA